MKTDKEKAGFTLIEIVVATSILGLLAALATYAVRGAITNSRIKTAEVELEMLATATLQLAWDTGRWPNQVVRNNPGSIEVWNISTDKAGLMGTDSFYEGWKGPYYEGEIRDPWDNPYFFDPDYRVDGVNYIAVGSFGPNGVGRNKYDSDDIYVLLND